MQTNHLSADQKAVLFDKATEPPFSGALLTNKLTGDYVCANCQNILFDSTSKYDSGCGWPSFDRAVDGAVRYVEDSSHGMDRIEVICAKCSGHLGHVFPDGPAKTTGQRYCINSLALGFEAKDDT